MFTTMVMITMMATIIMKMALSSSSSLRGAWRMTHKTLYNDDYGDNNYDEGEDDEDIVVIFVFVFK